MDRVEEEGDDESEDDDGDDDNNTPRKLLTHIERKQLVRMLAENMNQDAWDLAEQNLPKGVYLTPKQLYSAIHPDKFTDRNDKTYATAAFASEYWLN
jgi:hypothetical protein